MSVSVKKKLIIYLIFVTLAIVLDQVSKNLVINNLNYATPVEVIPNFFYLTLFYNTGAAWSSFSNFTTLLLIISILASLGISIYYFVAEPQRNVLGNIGLSLIIGGAIGNGIDRLLYQKVTDFLDFYIFGYDFPIFNIADSAVVIGVIILIISMLMAEAKQKKGKGEQA